MQDTSLIRKLLQEIADNNEHKDLTHTDVIMLATVIEQNLYLSCFKEDSDELQALLRFLQTDSRSTGFTINHSQRSRCALRILGILEREGDSVSIKELNACF